MNETDTNGWSTECLCTKPWQWREVVFRHKELCVQVKGGRGSESGKNGRDTRQLAYLRSHIFLWHGQVPNNGDHFFALVQEVFPFHDALRKNRGYYFLTYMHKQRKTPLSSLLRFTKLFPMIECHHFRKYMIALHVAYHTTCPNGVHNLSNNGWCH